MKKILCIGNALFDVLITEVEKQEVIDLSLAVDGMTLIDSATNKSILAAMSHKPRHETMGGSAANCARAARHLGAKVGYIGKVGRDDAGDKYVRFLENAGIESRILRSDSTPTGECISLIGEGGARSMATFLGAALEMQAEEISAELFEGYDIIFIEGYLVQSEALIRAIVAQAQALDMTIALDLASYNIVEESHELLSELIDSGIDIIFANESEAEVFCGTSDVDECLQEMSSRCLVSVLKLGGDGSAICSGDELVEVGVSDHVAIDTTAAGDYYAGAFLAKYAAGEGLVSCGRVASFLAGAITEVVGTELPDTDTDNN